MKNPYHLNTNYYGTHRIIAREINPGQSVLDIGCNDGYLKALSPGSTFVGIDFSKEALKRAKNQGYAKTIQADLNQYSSIKLRKKFDVIVFADILEHLMSPSAVLQYFVQHNLKSGGRVIISLPNVAHLSIRISLLLGRFDYTEAGILDRTHLHLYTPKTARLLAQNSKLKIKKILFSSNRLGILIRMMPALGGLLGFNIITVCQKS